MFASLPAQFPDTRQNQVDIQQRYPKGESQISTYFSHYHQSCFRHHLTYNLNMFVQGEVDDAASKSLTLETKSEVHTYARLLTDMVRWIASIQVQFVRCIALGRGADVHIWLRFSENIFCLF